MLDDIGLKILNILQEKARIPNVEVARQVGMAPSAVLERIRKLESQGYIDGYEVRLNPERFGRGQVAFVLVEVRGDVRDAGKALAQVDDVQEVHHIAGLDGLLVKVRVADTAALGRLVRQRIAACRQVVGVRTLVAMETFKETARIVLDGQEAVRPCGRTRGEEDR